MTLEQKVFERLTETFFAKFKVKEIAIGRCLVSIEDSDDRYFQMDVWIREHSRLIITVVPEKHAAELVETFNESSLQKRENFCDIWDNLGGRLKVKINDVERTKEDLLKNNFHWKNFAFRLSVPLYNEAINQEEKAAELTCTMCSLVLSLVDYSLIGEEEGKESVTEEVHKKRERSPINRQICIQLKGYNCSVCGMNFQKRYGQIGEHFIEIHHSIPVHTMEDGHEVDIKKELFPVCSNCHSMIHRRNPPYTIEELKEILLRQEHVMPLNTIPRENSIVQDSYSMAAEDDNDEAPIVGSLECIDCLNYEKAENEVFLLGCYKDEEQLAWIKGNGLPGVYASMQYNIRIGSRPGAYAKSNRIIRSATYLILYNIEDESDCSVYQITGHKLKTGEEMIEQGYSLEARDKEYFVYSLGQKVMIEGLNLPVTLSRLRLDTKHPHEDGEPIFMTGRELLS